MLAVNAGSGTSVNFQGVQYQGDTYATGGSLNSTNDPIAGVSEDALFQSERYGTYSYQVPVSEAFYTVDLHFVELFWNATGQRSFSVSVEGTPVLSNMDLFAQVGHDTAFSTRVEDIFVNDGNLSINLTTQVDNATLSGFAIYSEDGELVEAPPPVSGASAEFSGADCAIPTLPSPGAVGNQGAGLPDPFRSLNGSRITTAEQWRCRRAF